MKKIILATLFILVSSLTFSQMVDTSDKFYREAQAWESRGLTQNSLPQLRPYPLNVVKEILSDVIENNTGLSNETDIALANEEYERIFGKKFHFSFDGEFIFKHTEEDDDSNNRKTLLLEPKVFGDVPFTDLFGLGYSIGFYATTDSDYTSYIPYSKNILHDSIYDASSISKFDVFADWNTMLTFGKTNLYATAGVNRVGYGRFLNQGLALNDSAYHSINLILNASFKKFAYTQVLESVGATNNTNSEDFDNLSDNKFLVFHSLKFSPTDRFSISYYENIIFGPGFDLTYLIPAPLMAIQNIGGASSNLQMGLLFDVKIMNGLLWTTDIFVDDYSVNDFVKLNFDAKYRFALQSGINYYPENSSMKSFNANYTCVMPYVYSHWEYDANTNGPISGGAINYQNYTNNGICIGSNLEPNSDAISVNATFNPTKNLTVDLNTSFIRHANSAEAFDDEDAAEYVLGKKGQYVTNGTAFMHQMSSGTYVDKTTGRHIDQAWDCLGFMTSDHKMYVTQAGISAKYDFPKLKNKHQFSVKVGYNLEYIRNAGVNRNVYEGGNIEWREKEFTNAETGEKYIGYVCNGKDYAEGNRADSWDKLKSEDFVQDEIKKQKNEWISKLYDEIKHYFSISVKYTY